MKTIQKIFDTVIDRGFYASKATIFMCWALDEALYRDVITKVEHHIAINEIQNYLNGWATLQSALQRHDLPHSFPDRLAIYKNWANRPQLDEGQFSGSCKYTIN